MKKRIDTLLYDTDTAKELAQYVSPFPYNDVRYYSEWLYKKRTGEYFLYGEGNPGSPWAEKVPYDNAYIAGSDIKPLTFEQAKRWFEKAYNADSELATDEVYEQEFGTISTNNSEKVQTKIYLSALAKRKLVQLAQKQGKTQSNIVESLIMSE
ncbi:hypothetical protein [Lactobacillus gasseri]|uniref:hypothetical protein n=1 Tax=Lactobacillus gasseri TaxID=1596 RepID=UPI0011826898|nr:hypothetical protein [Lactobacillus gasseri]